MHQRFPARRRAGSFDSVSRSGAPHPGVPAISRFHRPPLAGAVALLTILGLALAGCDLLGGSSTPTPLAATATPAPPAPTATLPPPTETPVPPSPTPQALSGHITNAYTNEPVTGAMVSANGIAVSTDTSGAYRLDLPAQAVTVQVSAPGYAGVTAQSGASATLDLALRPTKLTGRVVAADTGAPLQGVLVRVDLPTADQAPADQTPPPAEPITPTATITSSGLLRGPGLSSPPQQISAAPVATGAAPIATATPAPPADTAPPAATATPVPPTATATPKPIMPTPEVKPNLILAVTDEDGRYELDDLPANPTMTLKLPGYALTKLKIGNVITQDVRLQPFQVKALYMTANAAAYDPLYSNILKLADTTEINAVVLNVQTDPGDFAYDSQVPLVRQSKALDLVLPHIQDTIQALHDHQIYVIARLTTFMEPDIAAANPDLAVMNSRTGKPWTGGYLSQQHWLDPTNPKAQDYVLQVVKEISNLGFDEIQFDYIRFPSDPAPGEKWDEMKFMAPVDDSTKPRYIEQFMTRAHDMLNETDMFMSTDIFGYTVWPDQNGEPLNAAIGQVFENMIGHTDYICPMIYPSHFSKGEEGYANPNAYPYEIVKQAGVYTEKRISGQRARYRPWLQAFNWYDDVDYEGDPTNVRLQIRATEETGGSGWQMWDPSNRYRAPAYTKQ